MKIRPASPLGYSRVERDLVYMAGVEVDLAPWETLHLPDELGRELVRRSKYKLTGGDRRYHIYPYQIKVRLTCPSPR